MCYSGCTMKELTSSCFRYGGDPSRPYRHYIPEIISHFNRYHSEEFGKPITTIEDLRSLAARGLITPSELFRFRGMGNKRQPGKLVLFVFEGQVKSREEQIKDKAILFAGDGI